MENSGLKKIFLFVLLACICLPALSQDGNPLSFLNGVSQSSKVNPAFQNKTEKLVLGLPFISGLNLNWKANFAMEYFTSDQFDFDFQKFYDSLNEPGNAFSTAEIPLIYLSVRKKKKNYSFSVTEKVIGTGTFDNEIMNFAAQGLQPYYNNNEQLGPNTAKSQYYREIALGYSNEIAKGLTIGIRPKLLSNRFYYNTNNISIDVTTNNEIEQLVLTPTGQSTISGPVKIATNEENNAITVKPDIKPSDYFFKFKNMGAGIDIGLSYQIDKQTEVALSVIDIEFASIKAETYNLEFTEALHYNGNRLYQSSDPDAPNYWSPEYAMRVMADSIPFLLTENDPGKRKINTLPLKINAQIKRTLSNKLQLGVANQFTYYKNYTNNYLTGFLHSTIGQNIEASSSLSLYNINKVMLGLGCSYTGNFFQFYLSTNNILELIQPSSAKNLNLWFGVNFLFSTN